MRRSREVVVGVTGGEDAAALHALMIFLTPAWLGNLIFAGGVMIVKMMERVWGAGVHPANSSASTPYACLLLYYMERKERYGKNSAVVYILSGPLGNSTDGNICSPRAHAKFGTSHVSWNHTGATAPIRMQLVLQLLLPLLVPMPLQRAQPVLALRLQPHPRAGAPSRAPVLALAAPSRSPRPWRWSARW